ncbi:leucine-rich repeat and IQ domain-containing protein 3-like isoform X1 [Rhincodon typus]|uniref:leucine-rich repeat and IQ domain-containing protein 3-like isoform X1 n=1 Tax=Rhincodon typus TaxID=259920 RepID=UPI00202E2C04|nr:leucine-rich repeat and IQ domain-containing protein 3-like isoform X1 [Rhincodon typus]
MAAFREQSARSKIFTDLRLDRSHLVSPSKSLILSCGEMDNTLKEKTLDKIVVVNLSRHYLKNLGSLSLCSALKICILSRNYITKIDALANCPNLIKLDLHGNHIINLPDEYFWSDLKFLQVLFLHDNIIGDIRTVKSLFSCPSLVVLTLFDTPVSLVPNYRHHIVNGILSLKALDHFVIADEEIIEDSQQRKSFRPLSPHFFFHLTVPPKISTWQSELNHLRTLLSTINKILAHRSPVLIIQRWSRGFLTRRKLSAPDSHNDNYEQTKKPSVELCSRGIHVLEDGSVWVAGSRGMDDGRCNSVQLQIDKNKLQIDLLEDRCEANEITSGLYPPISQWKMENTPNLKPNKSNVFHPRTFRQPVFDPNSDRARLL